MSTLLLKQVGKYEILKKLGRGGMADVYLAHDAEENRRVALKLIEAGSDPESQEIIKAETRGAEIQKKLSEIDPAIVRINEYGELEGHFYIDMEYVEGRDLAEFIRQGPLSPPQAIGMALRICDSLTKAHSLAATIAGKECNAVVHGDLKPTNIRIDQHGGVRILDFGIAKNLSATHKLTHNSFASAAYSSPERLGTGICDPSTDLWSLGVILYELVAGHQPFQAETTQRLEHLIRTSAPLPIPERCPEPLRKVIAKALARDRSYRYGSAEEFRLDLQAALEGKNPVLALEDENERTRRTLRDNAEDTRRSAAPDTPQVKETALSKLSPRSGTMRQVWIVLTVIAVLITSLMIANEVILWNKASDVQIALEPGLPGIEQALERYQELSARSQLGFGTFGLRERIRRALLSDADLLIARHEKNPSRAGLLEWRRVRKNLYRAYQLNPSDEKARTKLQYAEDQIHRLTHPTAARKQEESGSSFIRRLLDAIF